MNPKIKCEVLDNPGVVKKSEVEIIRSRRMRESIDREVILEEGELKIKFRENFTKSSTIFVPHCYEGGEDYFYYQKIFLRRDFYLLRIEKERGEFRISGWNKNWALLPEKRKGEEGPLDKIDGSRALMFDYNFYNANNFVSLEYMERNPSFSPFLTFLGYYPQSSPPSLLVVDTWGRLIRFCSQTLEVIAWRHLPESIVTSYDAVEVEGIQGSNFYFARKSALFSKKNPTEEEEALKKGIETYGFHYPARNINIGSEDPSRDLSFLCSKLVDKSSPDELFLSKVEARIEDCSLEIVLRKKMEKNSWGFITSEKGYILSFGSEISLLSPDFSLLEKINYPINYPINVSYLYATAKDFLLFGTRGVSGQKYLKISIEEDGGDAGS